MTPRILTKETPFKLTFGTEAMIPLDIGLPTPQVENFNQLGNDAQLWANLDLLDEAREQALIRMVVYRHRVTRYYNSQVKSKVFKVKDLVLRRAEVSQSTTITKLSPKWEDPYRVAKAIRPRAYQLQRLDNSPIPQT